MGAHLSVKPPGKEKWTRLYKIRGYTEQDIARRILEGNYCAYRLRCAPLKRNRKAFKPQKLKGFDAIYFKYLYMLGKVKSKHYTKPAAQCQRNVKLIHDLYTFIPRNNLTSLSKVKEMIEYNDGQRNVLMRKRSELIDENRKLQYIFSCAKKVNFLRKAKELYMQGEKHFAEDATRYYAAVASLIVKGYDTSEKLAEIEQKRIALADAALMCRKELHKIKREDEPLKFLINGFSYERENAKKGESHLDVSIGNRIGTGKGDSKAFLQEQGSVVQHRSDIER